MHLAQLKADKKEYIEKAFSIINCLLLGLKGLIVKDN